VTSASSGNTAGTDAEAADDPWLSNTSGPKEVMIWVDTAINGATS
jgi:hypothetical protein